MTEWITYGLQIEIIAIGLFIYGLAMFLKALRIVSDEFKFAILLILLSLVLEIIQGVMVRVLLFKQVTYQSPIWLVSPFLGLVGAFFLVLGARKFFLEIRK